MSVKTRIIHLFLVDKISCSSAIKEDYINAVLEYEQKECDVDTISVLYLPTLNEAFYLIRFAGLLYHEDKEYPLVGVEPIQLYVVLQQSSECLYKLYNFNSSDKYFLLKKLGWMRGKRKMRAKRKMKRFLSMKNICGINQKGIETK